MIIRHIRWWIARKVAPAPIISDPFPDATGVVLLYHEEDSWNWAMKAATFEMEGVSEYWTFSKDNPVYVPPVNRKTFTGTVH